jgi:hypothetical protein
VEQRRKDIIEGGQARGQRRGRGDPHRHVRRHAPPTSRFR